MNEVKGKWELLRTISSNEIENYPDYKRQVELNEMKLVERPAEYLTDVYIWKRAAPPKTKLTKESE